MNNLTAITFAFNQPNVTEHLIKSLICLNYDLKKDLNFTIADNSKNDMNGDYLLSEKYNTNYINNRGNRLKFKKDTTGTWGSTSHQSMIQYAIDNVIKTDYALLLDCDVLVKNKFDALVDYLAQKNFYTAGMTIKEGSYDLRIHPSFQLLNIKKMKENNIKYAGKLEFMKCDTGCEFFNKIKPEYFSISPTIALSQQLECTFFKHYGSLTHGGILTEFNRDEAKLNTQLKINNLRNKKK